MQVPEIAVTEVDAEIDAGAVLIDVREPDEFADVRAPRGRLVPLATVPENVGEFTADQRVLVICRSGGRSLQAAEFMRARGIDAVNVTGGTIAWVEAGLPTESGE